MKFYYEPETAQMRKDAADGIRSYRARGEHLAARLYLEAYKRLVDLLKA